MSRSLRILLVSFVLAPTLTWAANKSFDENLADPNDAQTGVVLIKVSTPVYPPTARAERVSGDVDLMLAVRQNGSIESAVVTSGDPMLRPAALDSAQHSQFECRKCSQAINTYRLVYTFQIEDSGTCPPTNTISRPTQPDKTYPRVAEAQNRVTVTAYIVCNVDPAPIKKRRSPKCVYLWRCGSY